MLRQNSAEPVPPPLHEGPWSWRTVNVDPGMAAARMHMAQLLPATEIKRIHDKATVFFADEADASGEISPPAEDLIIINPRYVPDKPGAYPQSHHTLRSIPEDFLRKTGTRGIGVVTEPDAASPLMKDKFALLRGELPTMTDIVAEAERNEPLARLLEHAERENRHVTTPTGLGLIMITAAGVRIEEERQRQQLRRDTYHPISIAYANMFSGEVVRYIVPVVDRLLQARRSSAMSTAAIACGADHQPFL